MLTRGSSWNSAATLMLMGRFGLKLSCGVTASRVRDVRLGAYSGCWCKFGIAAERVEKPRKSG